VRISRYIVRMKHANRIIQKLGGTRPAARALCRPYSTVQSWVKAGFIPAKHQQLVLDTAQKMGIGLTPADFFDDSRSRASKPKNEFE